MFNKINFFELSKNIYSPLSLVVETASPAPNSRINKLFSLKIIKL